jgi:tol-pal system protein YbgF
VRQDLMDADIFMRILKSGRMAFFALAILCMGWGCALQDDMLIVDRRVNTLSQKVVKNEKTLESHQAEASDYFNRQTQSNEELRSAQADLRALVDGLKDEMGALRGQLEESQHLDQQRGTALSEGGDRWTRMEKSVQGLLERIVRIEEYLGMEPSEKLISDKSQQPARGEETGAGKTPDQIYTLGKQHFDRAEYDKARELFQTYLKNYPKSENADNAQFWLGEICYRERSYEKAILEYQKVIEGYPKGNKVAGALLKQAFAFLNLGDKDNARLIFKELVRKYPESAEAKIAKEKLTQI